MVEHRRRESNSAEMDFERRRIASRAVRANSMRGAAPGVLEERGTNLAREGSGINWTTDGNLDDIAGKEEDGSWGGRGRAAGRISAGERGIHLDGSLGDGEQ